MLLPLLSLLVGLQGHSEADIPPPPERGHYVLDQAHLLDARSFRIVDAIGRARAERGEPLYVVTIGSLAAHGASGMSVRSYAQRLFDVWAIGDSRRNRGALLLVSVADREARIELGRGWNHEQDEAMTRVMSRAIVPAMREGFAAQGIVAGVQGIDAALSAEGGWSWPRRGGIALALLAGGWGAVAMYRRRRREEDAERSATFASIRPLIERARGRHVDPRARRFNPNMPRERPAPGSTGADQGSWLWQTGLGTGDYGGGDSSGGGDSGGSSGGGGADGSW